ncbi:hypothetical protein AB4212_64840, partial [Streptomyces sp. 2MCAF27]
MTVPAGNREQLLFLVKEVDMRQAVGREPLRQAGIRADELALPESGEDRLSRDLGDDGYPERVSARLDTALVALGIAACWRTSAPAIEERQRGFRSGITLSSPGAG